MIVILQWRKEQRLTNFSIFSKRRTKLEQRTKIVASVIRTLKLPPRFRLKMLKEDPVRLELSLTPSYGKNPVVVGLVESLDLVARRDREGRIPRDLQGTWDWTVRHGKGWSAYDKDKKNAFAPNNQRKYTIHPELLDKSGNITDEELLTVRFSNDSDSTLEKGTTSD